MNKHEIVRGAGIVAKMQLERHQIGLDLKQDLVYYGLHEGCERSLWRMFYKNRYKKDARRSFNPTRNNIAKVIQNLSYFIAMGIPDGLPCGAQDGYGDRIDGAVNLRRRLIIAYRYISWKNRLDKLKSVA